MRERQRNALSLSAGLPLPIGVPSASAAPVLNANSSKSEYFAATVVIPLTPLSDLKGPASIPSTMSISPLRSAWVIGSWLPNQRKSTSPTFGEPAQ